MADGTSLKKDKLKLYKPQGKPHSQVKDSDLQIKIQNDMDHFDQNFCSVLTSYLRKEDQNTLSKLPLSKEQKQVARAMDEASSSFRAMMQIREKLEKAYNSTHLNKN